MGRTVAKSPKRKPAAKKAPKKIAKKAVKKTSAKKTTKATLKTTRYVFFLRHGLRGDHVGPNVNFTLNKNPDPILTELGHKQCIESGKFLKQQLKQIEKK